jgi:hypothetical protein
MKLVIAIVTILLMSASFEASAQVNPPHPISVYVNPAQGLNFGAFFQGVIGGSVIIYPTGSRSVTGDIVQASLGFSFSPAIFDIEANPGTVISIMNGPDVQLSGSNGGLLTLHIGPSDLGTPFITTAVPPSTTTVRIGGTLTVGSPISNPAGSYSGYFSVTFNQE